jgi:hypothetical protein
VSLSIDHIRQGPVLSLSHGHRPHGAIMRSPQPDIRQGHFPATFTAPLRWANRLFLHAPVVPHAPPPPTLAGRPTAAPPHDGAPDAASLRERGGICLRARRVNERPCLALVNKSSLFSLRALPARSRFASPETRLIVHPTIGLVSHLSTLVLAVLHLVVIVLLQVLLVVVLAKKPSLVLPGTSTSTSTSTRTVVLVRYCTEKLGEFRNSSSHSSLFSKKQARCHICAGTP